MNGLCTCLLLLMALHGAMCITLQKLETHATSASHKIILRDLTQEDAENPQLEFYGIGAISGGGATSKLLQNYPKKQLDEILDFLFLPNFGASLHMLKVEIGGDSQSTEGTEASHMHNPWDQNYQRGYEWWLMKEAKKRNPQLLLYALPWAFPGWVGNGTFSPYSYPSLTVQYVVNWVSGAKEYHNLTVDYLGLWNERPYDTRYTKLLRQELDRRGFQNVRLIVGDGDWSPASDVLADAEFARAVFGLGAHYPGTESSDEAKSTGKPLWSSEDFSTFNDDAGTGCWARILNRNFVDGVMSSSIAWNLVASYYDNLPFPRCSLMTANEPWSGHYELTGPLWATAHTTQFAQPGWRYLPVGNGSGHLPAGGSFLTILQPRGNAITIVLETMSHDHSQCIRPELPPYTVRPQSVALQLPPSFANVKQLNRWQTRLSFAKGVASTYFQKLPPLPVVNGVVKLQLAVDELLTLSTVATATKGQRPTPPPSLPFPLPYSDSFQELQTGQSPAYLTPQAGFFESVPPPSGSGAQICQVVLQATMHWCPVLLSSPFTVIGNWSDIRVSVSARVPSVNSTSGVFAAARIDRGGCEAFKAMGLFVWVFPNMGWFSITNDLAQTRVIKSGPIKAALDTWLTISISIKDGKFSASVGSQPVAQSQQLPSATPSSGFVGFGTESFGLGCFANLTVSRPPTSVAWQQLLPSAVRMSQLQPAVAVATADNEPL